MPFPRPMPEPSDGAVAGGVCCDPTEHLLTLGWDAGHVFGPSPTRPFGYTSTTTRAKKAWKDAKLERLGLHEARHTFASLMIAAGVNAKALSTYMGHATISITLDRYGHLMPGNESDAAALLDAYLASCVPISCQSCDDSGRFEATQGESIPHG
jgi:integrase